MTSCASTVYGVNCVCVRLSVLLMICVKVAVHIMRLCTSLLSHHSVFVCAKCNGKILTITLVGTLNNVEYEKFMIFNQSWN